SDDIDAALSAALRPDDVKGAFAEAGDSAAWAALDAPATPTFPWSAGSSYLRPPPFALDPPPTRLGRYTARALMVLGDDMTTDHISPAGQIPAESEAGRYLTEKGENPADLNVYAARRGNWQVMLRGLFANRDARNLLAPDCPPATTPGPDGAGCMPLPDAAAALADAGQPLVIVAGERFGMGSSRDWAAKGQALLGVRAVLALGFERIHRANLIAMGILPLRLPANAQPEALNISPADRFEIDAASDSLAPGSAVPVVLQRADGGEMRLDCVAEIATRQEIRQLTAGGIIPLILSRARAAQE
ncbi:MAG: aconitate hydratase AcnA, partial [Paracoccus sp. (in: a-proteobacteria)]|nr:aconitate hydratase AcnA [Paracoccus sp. (in: a-proteobacteria)]